MDRGPENTKDIITLLANYDIYLSRILAYYPQANRLVEAGHKPILDALSKLTSGSEKG
jgi:hypothetical protein